jgi:hypothetical protein
MIGGEGEGGAGEPDLQPALVGVPAERLVPRQLAGLAVGGEEPPFRVPLLPPLLQRPPGGWQAVTGLRQPGPAPAHRHPPGIDPGFHAGEARPQRLHPPLLLESPGLGGVPPPAVPARPGRDREPALDRLDPASQGGAPGLKIPVGELPGILGRAGDRAGPPGRRPAGHRRFRTARDTARPLASRRPSRQRAARSADASDPGCTPAAARTAASTGVTRSRVRTRAPAGPATTNGGATSRSRPPTPPPVI